jgi:hypothetical protein
VLSHLGEAIGITLDRQPRPDVRDRTGRHDLSARLDGSDARVLAGRAGQSHGHRVHRNAFRGKHSSCRSTNLFTALPSSARRHRASWSAYYLARGFDVVATDPAPNAEANLRKYVDEAWPLLTSIGLSDGASRERLTFTTSLQEALSDADFVQENGPERPDFKKKLFADI